MSLRLGIDLDGVVADFRTSFRDAASGAGIALPATTTETPADPLSPRDIKRIWDFIRRTPNWWTQLKAYEPAQVRRLYELSRERRWEVVFLTRRPATEGDPVQFQSQWWLEEQGYYYPAVVTVPGSRGELANALRLDVVVDDQIHNCVDVIGASTAKALLLQRDSADRSVRDHANSRGIGVVVTLEEAIDVLTQLHETLKERKGRLQRLADWFGRPSSSGSLGKDTPDRNRGPLRPGPPGTMTTE